MAFRDYSTRSTCIMWANYPGTKLVERAFQVKKKNEKLINVSSRSPENLEFGHFALLFAATARKCKPSSLVKLPIQGGSTTYSVLSVQTRPTEHRKIISVTSLHPTIFAVLPLPPNVLATSKAITLIQQKDTSRQ